MKHLLLLRHAKAEPGAPGVADRNRHLAPRGERDAVLVGATLAADPPDAVLCSPAERTRETLDALLAALPRTPAISLVAALYGEPDTYLDVIASDGGAATRLLVVGHNPAIHATAMLLAGSGKAKLRDRLAAKFPTCALATIAFPADDWAKIRPGSGELVALTTPKDLGAPGDGD